MSSDTVCKRCGHSINLNGFCNNDSCPYANWPQQVKINDLIMLTTKEIELKYQVSKRVKADNQNLNNIYDWDDSKKVKLMEDFIDSYGLKQELMAYLQEIAKDEQRRKF
ncbi:MAG: hypothetical protein HQL46_10060 [Gammaproteobacteria bacterium]|nr:hypothetical protein [Gammaproteobacteria bacterium]